MKIPEKAEKTSKKRGLKAFLTVLFAAVLIAGAVELFCESALIFNSDRGIHELSSERLYFSESGEGPVFDTSGLYTDKIVFELGGESYDASGNRYPVENESMELSVHIKYEGDEDFTAFYDSQPAFLSTEVINVFDHGEQGLFDKKSADEVRIDIESVPAGADASDEAYSGRDFSGIYISKAYVKNVPEFNIYRAFTVFCASFLLIGAAVFSGALIKNPHIAFFFICVLSGLSMTAALPQNKVGNDEETHLQAVMDMASFPNEMHISDGVLNQLMVTDFNNPKAQPDTIEERKIYSENLNGACNYKTGERSPDFHTLPNRMPAYAASAIGVKAAKGLDAPWTCLIEAGRVMNLLMYAVIMTLAIRRIPCGKFIMMAVALFPQNLFLASTFSYDPFITAAIYLGLAYLMEEMLNPGRRINPKNQAIMAIALFAGCMVKAVYAPLMLTALLMPKEKFEKRTGLWIYRAVIVLLFLLLIASFIMPTVIAPSDTGDIRGGATSEVSQIDYILGDPVGYAVILIRQMILWIPQCFFGPDCTTFMGHIVTGDEGFKGYYPVVLLILLTAIVTDRKNKAEKSLCGLQKLWIFLMVGAACVLIWTSMYVAFTVPGAKEIAGVQGRYFIPLIFPLYILINRSVGGRVLARQNDICYYLLIISEAAVAMISVWSCAVSVFCL